MGRLPVRVLSVFRGRSPGLLPVLGSDVGLVT
jgi:hypothetical protein